MTVAVDGWLLVVADLFGKKDPSSCGRASFNVEEVCIHLLFTVFFVNKYRAHRRTCCSIHDDSLKTDSNRVDTHTHTHSDASMMTS